MPRPPTHRPINQSTNQPTNQSTKEVTAFAQVDVSHSIGHSYVLPYGWVKWQTNYNWDWAYTNEFLVTIDDLDMDKMRTNAQEARGINEVV